MLQPVAETAQAPELTPDQFREEIIPGYRPVVIRQLVKDWPSVQAQSTQALVDYVRSFDVGKKVVTYVGQPDIEGNFFYKDRLEGYNFDRIQEPLNDALTRIMEQMHEPKPASVYTGAVTIADHIPEFASENYCDLPGNTAIDRIWMGNAATVPTHYDMLDNLVCVVAGRRRFTLFPPEQLPNLYVGPLDYTPSGQPVSMVSVKEPDLKRYPRFERALSEAQVVELAPGDALYIPKLWWHHVESLEPFNAIVNYWWDHTTLGNDSPFTTLMHGFLSIRHLPRRERQAWQAFFNHYLFQLDDEDPAAHIPESKRGILGRMTPGLYQTIKRHVLAMMNR